MHNLGTVIRFEVTRTLKKKSFWIAALAVPVIAAFVGVIIFFSNKATSEQADSLSKEHFSVGVTDESKRVAPQLLKSVKAQGFTDKQAGKAAVQTGKIDAYFYYPEDVSKNAVEVYGKDVGLFKNNRYQDLASELLKQSAAGSIDPSLRSILQNNVKYSAVAYTSDGHVDKGILKVVAPGIFLVLFYFMIVTFGNQILTSITEEKENRVIEMILATIQPTTLLVGKLLSLVILAFTQMFTFLLPIVAGYFLFKDQLSLPSLDLSTIPLDPLAIGLGAAIFFVGFLLFTGILMTLGAAMPTAKEAGSFFGIAIAFLFGPLYAAPLFISSPDSVLVQALSYFPLTAPIPLLLRNAAGNLTLPEALISISLLMISAVVVISVGVRIFRFGALEYSRKLSLKEIARRKS